MQSFTRRLHGASTKPVYSVGMDTDNGARCADLPEFWRAEHNLAQQAMLRHVWRVQRMCFLSNPDIILFYFGANAVAQTTRKVFDERQQRAQAQSSLKRYKDHTICSSKSQLSLGLFAQWFLLAGATCSLN